jgi:hypothetical protein
MYEEPIESTDTAQEGIPSQQSFEVNEVAGRPRPANRTQDAITADWATRQEALVDSCEAASRDKDACDNEALLEDALESITPFEYELEPEKHHNWSIVRLPGPYEPFTIVGKPIEVPCYEMAMHHEDGPYTGEAYFPKDSVLRDQLKVPTRIVALHPAISYPDKPFILIQPRERRGLESSGRDDSLEKALSTAPGNWMQLEYDEETDCFEFCHSEQDPEDAPEYPGFVWDCLNALGECFDDDPEHPLQIFIREQQRLHMRS